jgi:nucleosome binding factor SPN SPT16 subunit
MKIENNLYKILDKECEVIGGECRMENFDKDEIKFLKEWKGEKDKMYFCYMSYGDVKVWEVKDCKNFDDVKKKISSGWEDYNEEELFDNVLFVDDGLYVKVI